jgi:hypothetical protein
MSDKKHPIPMTAEETYREDDHYWHLFRPKLTAAHSHITPDQIVWTELLIKAARAHMDALAGCLPPMQGAGLDLDDGGNDCDGELRVEWNVRGRHHFSFDVHRVGRASWFYLNYKTQVYEWGEWRITASRDIPPEALKYLARLNTRGT